MFLPPRDDLNSPDMYIPVMALVTYILLSVLLAGFRGNFHPELLGSITTTAIAVIVFEILCLKMAMYILSINNDSQLLDLVAYSGYKFVGIIITLVASEILTPERGTSGWVGWTVFVYTFLANAFFLVSRREGWTINDLPQMEPQLTQWSMVASFTQVCAASRFDRLDDAQWRYAHCCSLSAKPSDTVPVHIFVLDPIRVYVGSESRGTFHGGQERQLVNNQAEKSGATFP